MPVYSDDTLGFTVALKEILELEILFEEKIYILPKAQSR